MLKRLEGFNLSRQVEEFVREADRMISTYGWEEKTVRPYRFPVKVTEMVEDLRHYDRCSKYTKSLLIEEANGLVDIMNYWEAREAEATIRVKLNKTGKIRMVTPEEYEDTYRTIGTII